MTCWLIGGLRETQILSNHFLFQLNSVQFNSIIESYLTGRNALKLYLNTS